MKSCLVLMLWCACSLPQSPPNEALQPQVVLSGVTIRSYRGEDLVTAGRAAKLTYQRSTTDFVAYETLLRFPSRGRAGAGVELKAPELRGTLLDHQADGLGGVVFRASSGMVARTQTAHLDGRRMTAWGSAPIRIEGPGYALEAQDFAFAFNDETFSFTGATTRLGSPR